MTESNVQLPATVNKPKPARPRLWPLWLMASLALVATVLLALWGWQQWQDQKSLAQAIGYVEKTAERLEDTYSQTGGQQAQRIQALEAMLADLREKLATQQRQIDHTARELLEAGNRTRTDWLLAEAEYLLRVANQRMLIEKDFRGALAALKSADQVLAETDDIGVYPVREQVAKDILALRGIADVDRTGLYLQLEAAIGSIHQLTDSALIEKEALTIAGASDDAASDSTDNVFLRAWRQTKETLGQVVVVRRLDTPVKALMSPEQSAYARLNMQLMLEEAELAVLRGNQTLYDRALAKATNALTTWYDTSDERIRALQASLDELQGKSIDPALPDISQSLVLLKARIAGRTSRPDSDTRKDSGGDTL
ncbi:uroporphyrinogen-III C-methyltransferase [Marinobacter caseinilyticus]|uniref:uroporphyrinogen-III C-methyltransferase n=1 Tax=Marinobacter caseinilyticus TaxID=2692195 RepID=UPI001F471D5D|nr:uroporphyrinogen-III C-methyltransferase [Marinobacter caseinilyticus]